MMIWFWSVLVIIGLVVGRHVLHETAIFLGKRWDRRLAIDERAIALQERAHEVRARALLPPAMPPELLRRITRWQDPSAQDSERAVILALYDEFRDQDDPWSKVKAHLAPEPDERYDSPLLS